MIRQSKCSIVWIDLIKDINICDLLQNKYPSNIEAVIHDLLLSVDIEATEPIMLAMREISIYGISEMNFLELHRSIFDGPNDLAGVYRPIVMMAGEYSFVDFWEIQREMTALFDRKYQTVGEICYWMIEALGRIHPFIDMNRRTIFLAADAHLLSLGLSPIYWGKNRNLWENARKVSQGIDAKKRLHILMESILGI